MKRKIFTALDAAVVLSIVIICIAFTVLNFCFKDSGDFAVVSVNNEEVLRLSLKEDTERVIETEYGSNTLCVKNGTCYVADADCKDKICKNHSPIKNTGEAVVCLPHKLIVEVQ